MPTIQPTYKLDNYDLRFTPPNNTNSKCQKPDYRTQTPPKGICQGEGLNYDTLKCDCLDDLGKPKFIKK
mgnify:CR=1 FL=1